MNKSYFELHFESLFERLSSEFDLSQHYDKDYIDKFVDRMASENTTNTLFQNNSFDTDFLNDLVQNKSNLSFPNNPINQTYSDFNSQFINSENSMKIDSRELSFDINLSNILSKDILTGDPEPQSLPIGLLEKDIPYKNKNLSKPYDDMNIHFPEDTLANISFSDSISKINKPNGHYSPLPMISI